MPRKKKEIQQVREAVPETASSSISYKGNVTIKLVKGGKIIKSIKKHNTGCPELFKFLTECLVNLPNENSHPKYLRCFTFNDSGDDSPSMDNLGNNALIGDGYVSYTDADSVEDSTTTTYTYKSIFRFIIPSTIIRSNINVVAIYNVNKVNEQSNPSAFMQLTGKDIISTNNLGAGISVIVIWEMSFQDVQSSQD